MGKQWVRQEIKKNEIASAVGLAALWAAENRRKTLAVGGGILCALLVAALVIYQRHRNRETAWEKLAIAQSISYQGHPDQAIDQIKTIETQYSRSTASGFGMLFAGDILYRQGKYKEAAEIYHRLVDRQDPKTAIPIALSDLGISQESAGDCKIAIDTEQRFLDSYQDHFLAPQVHASMARCLETLGMKEKAKSTYERISLLYPDSFWAKWAQEKLKGA